MRRFWIPRDVNHAHVKELIDEVPCWNGDQCMYCRQGSIPTNGSHGQGHFSLDRLEEAVDYIYPQPATAEQIYELLRSGNLTG